MAGGRAPALTQYAEAVLHESVLARLAAGQTDQAVAMAVRLVGSNAVANSMPGTPAWLADLEEQAGQFGMRDFLARSVQYRNRLGEPVVSRLP